MYLKKFGISAKVVVGERLDNSEQSLYIVATNDIGMDEKVINWQFNGYGLLEIDGIFTDFKIAKKNEITRLLELAKEQEFDTKSEMDELMEEIFNLFEDYLIRSEYPFMDSYEMITERYKKISQISVELISIKKSDFIEVSDIDIENGFAFGFFTTYSIVELNSNMNGVLDSIRIVANILKMKKTSLHFFCNMDIKTQGGLLSPEALLMMERDGAIISLHKLNSDKTSTLVNLQQFTMKEGD